MKRRALAGMALAGLLLFVGCAIPVNDNVYNAPAEQENAATKQEKTYAAPAEQDEMTTVQDEGDTAPVEQEEPPAEPEEIYIDHTEMEDAAIEEEVIPLAEAPAAIPDILEPVASGISQKSGGGALIDYSNVSDGYVMVKYDGGGTQRLKVQVKGPSTTYTYNLSQSKWEVFPLSDGNGDYKVSAFENVSGDQYAMLTSLSLSVVLSDEFAPFLRPNQYVDYGAASNAVEIAARITNGMTDPLEKVGAVYDYVVKNLSYDAQKAASVQSGYLPVLDKVLETKKGICFDYAALMTGMLRSQAVPCKLVVGFADNAYHAWISVWTEQSGWIDGVIFFDGSRWQRMDPTFASAAGQSAEIMKYIGDGSHYTSKYLY